MKWWTYAIDGAIVKYSRCFIWKLKNGRWSPLNHEENGWGKCELTLFYFLICWSQRPRPIYSVTYYQSFPPVGFRNISNLSHYLHTTPPLTRALSGDGTTAWPMAKPKTYKSSWPLSPPSLQSIQSPHINKSTFKARMIKSPCVGIRGKTHKSVAEIQDRMLTTISYCSSLTCSTWNTISIQQTYNMSNPGPSCCV